MVEYSVDLTNYAILERLFGCRWFNEDATTQLSEVLHSPLITHSLLCMNISLSIYCAMDEFRFGTAPAKGGNEIKLHYGSICGEPKFAPFLPQLNAILQWLKLAPYPEAVLVFKELACCPRHRVKLIQCCHPRLRIKFVQCNSLRLRSTHEYKGHHLVQNWIFKHFKAPINPGYSHPSQMRTFLGGVYLEKLHECRSIELREHMYFPPLLAFDHNIIDIFQKLTRQRPLKRMYRLPSFTSFRDFWTGLPPHVVTKLIEYAIEPQNAVLLEQIFRSKAFEGAQTRLAVELDRPSVRNNALCFTLNRRQMGLLYQGAGSIKFHLNEVELQIVYWRAAKILAMHPSLNTNMLRGLLHCFGGGCGGKPIHGTTLELKNVSNKPTYRVRLAKISDPQPTRQTTLGLCTLPSWQL